MHGFMVNGAIGNTVGDINTVPGTGKQIILYTYEYSFKILDFEYGSETAIGVIEDEECRTDNLIGGW